MKKRRSIGFCKSCENFVYPSRRHTFVIAIRRKESEDSLPVGDALDNSSLRALNSLGFKALYFPTTTCAEILTD